MVLRPKLRGRSKDGYHVSTSSQKNEHLQDAETQKEQCDILQVVELTGSLLFVPPMKKKLVVRVPDENESVQLSGVSGVSGPALGKSGSFLNKVLYGGERPDLWPVT